MFSHKKQIGLLIALTWLALPAVAGDPGVISIEPQARVDGDTVMLGDVLSQSPLATVPTNLAGIELHRFVADEKVAVIDRSQIEIQLQLRGLRSSEYRLKCPLHVIAWRGEQTSNVLPVAAEAPRMLAVSGFSDFEIEMQIKNELARRFGQELDTIEVRLLRSVESRLGQDILSRATQLEVISPVEFPLGQQHLMLRFLEDQSLLASQLAHVEIAKQQPVLVCHTTVRAGETLSDADFAEELRFVNRVCDVLMPDDVVGTRLRRTLAPGHILSASDLAPTQRQGEELVRVRDSVRVVAVRKGVRFTIPAAEAMQSGRKGQIIRVRNLRSKQILTGQVVDRGLIEVPLE